MTAEVAIRKLDTKEARLARGIRSGDPASWRDLYEELGERVFRLVHRITGDEELASDVTHDTFVMVAEKGWQYEGRGSLAHWIFRIAGNLARGQLRKVKSRRRLKRDAVAGVETRRDAPDTELALVLREAVADLSEQQRVVLLLHEVDGYVHSEIAEMLNIAEGTSKARLSRGRALLRERLRQEL